MKQSMSSKKLGSYPTISVFITITTALFMVGLFALFALHATALTSALQENVGIQVYLEKDLDKAAIAQIGKTIATQAFVEISEGKAQINFVSKEDAAKKLISDTGEDFVESL